jgi:hypothetical protein
MVLLDLRLPWNGGQGRPQFQLDNLFRGGERGVPQGADRGAAGGGGDNNTQYPIRDSKITSPLQKVLDGK